MKNIALLFTVIGVVFMAGCASTKVTRVPVEKMVDLSGEWNDYDATDTAKAMIADCLGGAWRETFLKDKGKDPTVIVGHVANKSYEHIDSSVITKSLEREMLNSGKVVFVASSDERVDVRAERQDQQAGLTDPETVKKIGKERGADYMLIGNISSVKDQVKGKAVVFYQVNLELIDIETNVKAWMGQKQIKKYVENPKFSM